MRVRVAQQAAAFLDTKRRETLVGTEPRDLPNGASASTRDDYAPGGETSQGVPVTIDRSIDSTTMIRSSRVTPQVVPSASKFKN